MEYIQIKCNKCNSIRINSGVQIIDLDDVKNIIDSNYVTYIYYCGHKVKELNELSIDVCKQIFFGIKYTVVTNDNYANIYNKFVVVEEDNRTLKILLNNSNYECIREISIEEFKSIIKKGSIIFFHNYKLIHKLEKILLEHNFDFTLKKMEYSIFVVDTLNYTKPAL